MSHKVTVSLQFRDRANLKRTCRALKIDWQEGPHQVALFAGAHADTDFSVQLPGWKYRMAINTLTGEAAMDNYGGKWGSVDQLNRFAQEYALQVSEHEDSVQDLLLRGWTATRVKQPNGTVDLVLENG